MAQVDDVLLWAVARHGDQYAFGAARPSPARAADGGG